MADTYDEPMTANELRSRFWAFDEARTNHYKDFTMKYIEVEWCVEFKLVEKEDMDESSEIDRM